MLSLQAQSFLISRIDHSNYSYYDLSALQSPQQSKTTN